MEYNSTYLYLISKQMWSRNDSSQSSPQHMNFTLKMCHDFFLVGYNSILIISPMNSLSLVLFWVMRARPLEADGLGSQF